MLRIALCDDEKRELGKTTELVKQYFQARPSLFASVEEFESGEKLLARTEKVGGFHIYILDILMPGLGGIDVGRQLRTMGDDGEIIFLTASNDFAADSYEIRTFFYMLKPVRESKLFQVLDGAIEKLERRRNSAIVVNTANGPRRIQLEHIRFIERVGHYMRYHCKDCVVDSQSIRSPFKTAAAQVLNDRRFCLCGVSYVLNFQYVTGVKGQCAFLDNGQTISLPRAAAIEFKKAWGSYWLEERPI